jgi:hypothetical protein
MHTKLGSQVNPNQSIMWVLLASPWHIHYYLLWLEVSVLRFEFLDYCLLQVGSIVTHLDPKKGIKKVIGKDGSAQDIVVSVLGPR